MCDDLITQHYLTLTPPPHNKPQIWFATQTTQHAGSDYKGVAEAEVTMFTHYGSDIKEQITWLIVPSEYAWVSFCQSKSQISSWYNITNGGKNKWTINCYSKRILSDRLQFGDAGVPLQSFTFSEIATDINMLYEMKLQPTPGEASSSNFLRSEFTYDTPSEASMWYQAAHPAEATSLLGEKTGKEFVVSLIPTGSATTAASADRVGFATVLVGPEGGHGKQRFYVSNLWVDKRWRRRGAGKMLMDGVRRRVWEYGHPSGREGDLETLEKEIWLTVLTENTGAVAMYFRLGYQVERTMWVVTGGKSNTQCQ